MEWTQPSLLWSHWGLLWILSEITNVGSGTKQVFQNVLALHPKYDGNSFFSKGFKVLSHLYVSDLYKQAQGFQH